MTGKCKTIGEKGTVEFEIDDIRLLSGKYFIDVRIQDPQDVVYDCIYSLFEFQINKQGHGKETGIVSMDCKWN